MTRAITDIEAAVRGALAPCDRVVLAVSGGRDSMVMLDAAARVARDRIAAVVAIDHGTGRAATEAATLVESVAGEHGLTVVRRRVSPAAATEDAWRRARWLVLNTEAARRGALIATAHTRDDQAETVLMRVLRQAGARGLAGLASSGAIVRPLLGVGRETVGSYAGQRGVAYIDDPSNRDLRFLRNRVRLQLLPAMEAATPGFTESLVGIGARAAAWRAELEAVVAAWPTSVERGELRVPRAVLAGHDAESLRTVWPALAGRIGLVLDRRGTERLTSFTIRGRGGGGGRIQLSGGAEVSRHGEEFILRRETLPAAPVRRLGDETTIGGWRFVRTDGDVPDADWSAALPIDLPLRVRTWRSGDRIVPRGERSGVARRVKRLLREAGIDAGIRPGWPVVLSGDEIVWVPGVRRGTAATVRSGRPVAVYRCERIDS